MTPVRVQKAIAFLSVLLFIAKITAWFITHSVTVLTDALESTVNVIAGFIGLYSILLAARPRDVNHPYGHGKAEFVSAAVEGALIIIAGLVIIYEAVAQLLEPYPLHQLDTGLIIIAFTGLLNYGMGYYAVKQGKEKRSMVLESAGNHLKTDAYSTLAIIVGLLLLLLTGWQWLDSVVALIFSLVIIRTGYKVTRRSLSGIMDESDVKLLQQVISLLQEKRKDDWVDLHNLRVIGYGERMHIDAHLTLPWYYDVRTADKVIHEVEDLISGHFGNKVEVFIHIDACQDYSCKLCAKMDCKVRQHPYTGQLTWTIENVWRDDKHGKEDAG